MENAIKWFSRNHVAANFLMIAVILAGFYTWFQLKKEVFPDIQFDAFSVAVPYPNATPEEVAEGVCVPIEEAIAEIDGIKRVKSKAAENLGTVSVEVKTGYRVRDVMDDAKTRIDAITNFSENTEEPILTELVMSSQVLSVAVIADTDEKTHRKIAEQVRDGLLDFRAEELPAMKELAGEVSDGQRAGSDINEKVLRALRGTPGLTKVQIAAARPYEISIEVSENDLQRLGLSINEIAAALRANSLDLPGGAIKTKDGELIVRTMGKRYGEEDFVTVPVFNRPDGTRVLLGEIASVVDGFEDVDLNASFDGTPAVLVNVFRVGQEDTLEIAKSVREFIEQSQSELPVGVRLEIWNDQSKLLEGRLGLLGRNIATGLLLVLLVLTLFLRPSLALLVALGIPVSFMGGVWMMPHLGVSINMISAFAFILVLGIVVDDAIVVGENVYSRIRSGEHPREASWRGTHEVGIVVIFGILTTMAAFTPMLGLSGVSGKIWPNIPLIVIPVLAFSLLQSKLVLPAHLALLKPTNPKEKKKGILRLQQMIADGLEAFIDKFYTPFLRVALRHRYIVLVLFLALFSLTISWVASGRVKSMFFPDVETEVVQAKYTLPNGSPYSESVALTKLLEDAILEIAEEEKAKDGKSSVIRHVLASAGTQPLVSGLSDGGVPTASNIGEISVELAKAIDRDLSAVEIAEMWRERVGKVAGTESLTFMALSAAGGNAIDLSLSGNDISELRAASQHIQEKLTEYKGVIDINDTDRPGKKEIRFVKLTPLGRAEGMTLASIAQQVRGAYFGDEVQRLQRGRDEVKVMVRFPEEERNSLSTLQQMKVKTPLGNWVSLKALAEVEEGRGPDTVERTDRRRVIDVRADVTQETTGNKVVGALTEDVLNDLKKTFPSVSWKFEGEQEDQANSIREMVAGFIFALIGMYVLMAIPLRSYFQPIIVMFVIPFGAVGAIWGHIAMGRELSIMSLCGVVALAGVVVNDSLVLVDYVNRGVRRGLTAVQAARRAGAARFRAILLTSLTTFVGLMPMLFDLAFFLRRPLL